VLGICAHAIWALIEWQDSSSLNAGQQQQPRRLEPWILYVALVWGLLLGIEALKVHFDRPTTETEIDREVSRRTKRD
jgi:hypothetical protein